MRESRKGWATLFPHLFIHENGVGDRKNTFYFKVLGTEDNSINGESDCDTICIVIRGCQDGET